MPLIAVEVVLGCVPVVWGVWELMSLRRERRRDAEEAGRAVAGNSTGVSPSSSTTKVDPATSTRQAVVGRSD